MIKHGVVMVTSLIFALCLLGAVSASDMTASDVDIQIDQEDTQVEIAQSSDTSAVEVEEGVSPTCQENAISDSETEKLDENIESVSSASNGDVGENAISYYDYDELSYEYDEDCSSIYSVDGELLDVNADEIIPICLDSDLIISGLIDNDLASANGYKLGFDVTTAAGELLEFESAEDILVIASVDSTEINDVTAENVLNGIMDASNGYVTYGKGNLVTLSSLNSDLISIAFFIKKGESLTMAFYKNGAITSLCSSDVSSQKSAGLWKMIINAWADGFSKGVAFDENLQHFSVEREFEKDMTQPLLGCNNILGKSGSDLLGVPENSNGDAFIWSVNNPDKGAYFSADSRENESLIGLNMENNTSENGMITVMSYNQSNKKILKVENSLNPDVNIAGGFGGMTSTVTTPEDIKQIGVDAAWVAIAYFKSRGIDVIKDYENFYVFTSAGYATVNGLNTRYAIYGLLEVFGSRMGKNIYLVHTPMWKDLVFYFIWVNGANSKDFISYALKYDPSRERWVFSSVCKMQGDYIAHELGLWDDHHGYPGPYHHDASPESACLKDVFGDSLNYTNLTKKIGKETNESNASVSNIGDEIVEEIAQTKVNPYNILYTVTSIFMVCALFGVSYSKP